MTGLIPAVGAGTDSILVAAIGHSWLLVGVVLLAYLFLHLTSGRVVHYAFGVAGVTVADEDRDTGTAIGKIENVLVLTLMLLEAYTALGVIFAAKSLVRKDDIDTGDTSYYLLGTLANFTYSVVVGMVVHVGLRFLIA